MAFNIPLSMSLVELLGIALVLITPFFGGVVVTLWLQNRLSQSMDRADVSLRSSQLLVDAIARLDELEKAQEERASVIDVHEKRLGIHADRLREFPGWQSDTEGHLVSLQAQIGMLRHGLATLAPPGPLRHVSIPGRPAGVGLDPVQPQSPVRDDQRPWESEVFQAHGLFPLHRLQDHPEAAADPAPSLPPARQAFQPTDLPTGSYASGVSARPSDQPIKRRADIPQQAYTESAPEGHGITVNRGTNTEPGGVVPTEEGAARDGRMGSGYTSGSLLMGSDDDGRFADAEEDAE